MHRKSKKAKKQREEQKNEVVYHPEHPRDRLRRKTKNTVEETLEEDEVVYLGT